MKSNNTLEMSEAEFIAITTLAERIVDRFCRMVDIAVHLIDDDISIRPRH